MSRAGIQDADRAEVAEFIERHWGSKIVMSRGKVFYPHEEQGFLERRDGAIVGLLTYHIDEEGMEVPCPRLAHGGHLEMPAAARGSA